MFEPGPIIRNEISLAMKEAEAAIIARARASAFRTLKCRARDYRDRPARLEILYPGLSIADPRKMIAIGEALLHSEAAIRRPAQIVPTILINAKAVILLGRYQRRYAKPLETA